MDSIKSFKGYGKVDESENREFHRKTRRRLIVIGISAVLLLAIVVAVAIGIVVSRKDGASDDNNSPATGKTFSNSIKAVCSVTRYPDTCYSSISAVDGGGAAVADPVDIFRLSLRVAADGIAAIAAVPDELSKGQLNNRRVWDAFQICKEMLDSAADHLNASIGLLIRPPPALTAAKIDDLRTWLSGAVTDQETCLDAFEGTTGGFREEMEAAMRNSTRFTSNGLAIAAGILGILQKFHIPIHRKLLAANIAGDDGGMPAWVLTWHRRVLLQAPAPAPGTAIAVVGRPAAANVTVAQDGSGDFKTIGEAVAAVPEKSLDPYVIHVKEGKYTENVVVDKKKWNLVLIGDGMTKTVISGRLNFVDGVPTFKTATFAVEGKGFMAMDMAFENTAGPEKHQAVAFRSKSDRSVYYRCAFNGYQDTLYAHSLHQFYRDCTITGTIDFIFGDASAVFQSCSIRPVQPLPNQKNTITAQGRTDPNQNTGISIHTCTIDATAVDSVTAQTFLGRPWKEYSTTVVMRTEIGGVVDPKGWLAWDGEGSDPPSTIFYAEYQNTGPRSGTAGRVQWAGYRPTLTGEEAQKFAVEDFIQGSQWLPRTGVAHTLSL